MPKKNKNQGNYLDFCPIKNETIGWTVDGEGIVTLSVENKGFFNKIAQKFFKRPKVSYVHLDENGSFVWQLIDGEKTIADMGEDVKQRFGDAANPLYERLVQFFKILKSYGFIEFK